MSTGPNRAVSARIVAAAEHGVLWRAELRQLGVSSYAISARLRSGEMTGAGVRGLFVVADAVDDFTSLAITLARSELLAVSHRLAAAIYRWDSFDRPDGRLLDDPPLVCPWTSRRDLRSYRRRDLSRTELRSVGGLRVPEPGWTLRTLEEASHVTPDRLEQAVECALRRRDVTEDELWAGAGPQLAVVLATRAPGTPPTGSLLETLAVQRVLRPYGIAVVARQVEVFGDGVRPGRPDFLLEGWTFLEVDGSQHDQPGHRRADRARDVRIEALGPTVVRVGPEEIGAPGILARRLLRIVDRGRRAHPGWSASVARKPPRPPPPLSVKPDANSAS